MKSNFKSTLVLTAVLGALIGWYFLYEQKYRPQAQEKEEKTKQLITLEKDQIQEVEIVHIKNAPKETEGTPLPVDPKFKPEFETIKLKKSGSEWLITEPLSDDADTAQVSAMVSTLATSKQERVVEEKPTDLAGFGLKDVLIKVIAKKDSTSKPEEVWIGLNTPVGYSAYAKVAGQDPVFKVSRNLKTNFDKQVKDLRNKNLITNPRQEITEYEIQNAKGHIVLKKDDKDNWTLASENFTADPAEAGKTFSAIVEVHAKDFAAETADHLEKFGLAKPLATVTLTIKDKPKITLLVGKVKDTVYVKRGDKPVIYEVDKQIAERVEKPAIDYRSMNLATFNRYDVKRIKLEGPKNTVELVKGEQGDWSLPTDATTKVKTSEVDTLLTAIQDAKVSRYLTVPKDKGGVKKPNLTIRLFEKSDKGENEKVVLKFDQLKGKEVLGEREDLSVPFYLKSEDYYKINVGKEKFVQPETKQEEKDPKKS